MKTLPLPCMPTSVDGARAQKPVGRFRRPECMLSMKSTSGADWTSLFPTNLIAGLRGGIENAVRLVFWYGGTASRTALYNEDIVA